jgi:hypothetical protein
LVDGKQVGTVRSDSNADFLFSTNQVAPGTETFGFVGTDKNGATSITSSVVFEVVQGAITTVANVFLPPSIAVSATRIPPGEPLTISGYTVPFATTTVLIQPGETKPIIAAADKSGAWAIQVDTASLKNGFHTAKAAFQLSPIIKSGYGKALNFYVGTDLPKNAPSPDLNHDGKVNLVDFSIFLLSWNTDTWDTDFNQDGTTTWQTFPSCSSPGQDSCELCVILSTCIGSCSASCCCCRCRRALLPSQSTPIRMYTVSGTPS